MKSCVSKNNKMEHRYSKLLLAIVLYSGLAKLNSDWLIEAMPLKIWLPNNNLPLIGSLLNETGCITPSVGPEPFTISGVFYYFTKEPTIRFIFSSGVCFLTKILFQ
jgi:hypothetical protein